MATINGDTLANTYNDTVSSSDLYNLFGGNDTVYAGGGTDTLYGGDNDDLLYGGIASDTLYGDAGNDRLFGGTDNVSDTLYGGDNDDTLDGGPGSDRLFGGTGNDLLYAGAFGDPDADILDGGDGQDTVDFSQGTTGGINVSLVAGNDTVNPPSFANRNTDTLIGIEHIIGTNFDDIITGDTVANMLDGGANDDILSGGDNTDTLYGGTGADDLFGGNQNDTLYGGAGIDSLVGDAGDDLLYGDADVDTVQGSAGNDVLYGGLGGDRLQGGTENDTLYGGDGADSMSGDAGNDILLGGDGADTLDGGTGTDTASYAGSADGVNVTINASGNTGGDAAGDTLTGIENLTGSSNADTLVGDAGNNVIDGGDGTDTINGGIGADTLLGGAGADTIAGGIGNDSINGGTEADQIDGGLGNDTIDGGSGDDVITAGPTVTGSGAPAALDFNWDLVGPDGTDITAAGVTQNTGGVNVNVVLTTAGANFVRFDVETSLDIYVDTLAGETFNNNSSAWFERSNNGAATVANINFSGVPGAGFDDTVENVRFRISDIDQSDSNWRDRIIVRAYDANGVLIPGGVVFTETSADITTSGSTITANANAGDTSPNLAEGSVLVTVAGPVSRIEITYDNLAVNTQYIYVSDIHFDAIPAEVDNDSVSGGDGNDTIFGGIGQDTLLGGADNDVLYGGAGNDTLNGGTGNDRLYGDAGTDTLSGAAGNDAFVIQEGEVDATGNDIIFGGGGTEEGGTGLGQDTLTDYDVIDLTAIGTDRIEVIYTSSDPLNLVGTIEIYQAGQPHIPAFLIGVIQFSEIERIVPCFTPGTMIRTDQGDVAVEMLQPGDMVMTRDNGLQPLRWTGARKLSAAELQAKPDLQPVRIAKGALAQGPSRTMLVSPQHRVLVEGARAELLFGEVEVLVPAKHLVGQIDATRALPAEGVTYIHILFDHHEIVQSDGIWTESFQPAERTLSAMDAEIRAEVLALFPALETDADTYAGARLSLKAHEARVLLAG